MRPRLVLHGAVLLALAACGSAGSGTPPPPPPATHGLLGAVTGLAGSGLVLQLNGGHDLAVAAGASAFYFAGLVEGSAYAVTVKTQPSGPAQQCQVTGGTGSVAGADVTGAVVACVPLGGAITLSGTVSGVVGRGLVIKENGLLAKTLPAGTTAFTFPGTLAVGAAYQVTVDTQPYQPWQTCTVVNGAGIAAAAVTDVAVVCVTDRYAVSGQVTGLTGQGLLLQLDDGPPLEVPAGARTFAFPPIPSMTSYTLRVAAQPTSPAETCTVVSAGGPALAPAGDASQVTFGDNANALVDCGAPGDGVGGVVSGLTGDGLTLLLNGGAPLAVPPGAADFAFSVGVATGARYGVTIASQPARQACLLQHAKGVKGAAAVASVGVACLPRSPDPLAGTYSHAPGGLRTYLTFWPDGTYLHASRDENPACPSGGDGVEYGTYRYVAATGEFRFQDALTDSDGFCGFVHGGGANLGGALTRTGTSLTITSASTGRSTTWEAVASTPGALVGAFTWAYGPSAGTDGSIAVFHPDGTFIVVEAQQGASGGATVGYQRACYALGAGTFTVGEGASCQPDGAPVVVTSSGGIDPGVATPYAVTGPDTILVDTMFLLSRLPGP